MKRTGNNRKGKRKCNRCGKYGHVGRDDMVHTGYGRVMRSEAAFAHRSCLKDEDY